MGRTNSTRRRTTTAALVCGLLVTASACGGDDAGGGSGGDAGPVTLTWQMWSGSEVETQALERLSEMVTEEHPDITLDIQTSTFNDYWTRLAAAASGGDVACLLGVQGQRVPGVAQLLRPLSDEELSEAGIDTSEINGEMVQALQSDGEQLAIPYDLGPQVVFYNADAFEAAGLPEPAVGWTVDDFDAAAATLAEDGQAGYGFFPTYDQFTAWTMTREGEQGITEDGELQLTEPAMTSTFEYLQGLVDEGVSPVLPATNDTSAALNDYMAGNTAMVVDGPWQYGNILQNASFTPGLAPMPAGPDGSQSVLAGSGYGISSSCEEPEAALQALAVLTGPDAAQYLGESGRAYPARPAQAGSWYQGELADAEEALTEAIDTSVFLRTNEQMTQLYQLFSQYGIPAYNGETSAEQFLGQVQSQLGS